MEEKNNPEEKEMTINDLAVLMSAGFEKSSKQTDEKIESLARIVQSSFLSVEERLGGVEGKLDGVEGSLGKIETGVENIKANLNKKVDRFEHKELEIRVEKVEEKLKLKQRLKFA